MAARTREAGHVRKISNSRNLRICEISLRMTHKSQFHIRVTRVKTILSSLHVFTTSEF